MSKKVLVISASPRKKGNSDLLYFKTGLRNGYRRITVSYTHLTLPTTERV